MNSGMLEHSYFEELCALASVGQISPPEYQELSEHLRGCAACRDSYSEFLDVTHTQLPLMADDRLLVSRDRGLFETIKAKHYKARFAVRARELNINIGADENRGRELDLRLPTFSLPRPSYQYAYIAIIIVLLGTVGLLSHRWKNENIRTAAVSTELLQLAQKNATLQRQLVELSQGKRTIETDLLRTRGDKNDLGARLRGLEERVKLGTLSLQNLQAQLDASAIHEKQTEQKLSEAEQTVTAANQEAAKLRNSHAERDSAAVTQELQIADLSSRNKDLSDVIDKLQKLLAVDTDVRNLMAARNLHITDVFDVDGRGKRKSAFGRVFYTEGKSLIFYAFDLDSPKLANAKHSFQAWGQLSDSSSAVNLGIFYVDDAAQKRWMLRFDNPNVLRQINAVFVTAEAHGGAARPSGQKLMYAYLGHEPNHP